MAPCETVLLDGKMYSYTRPVLADIGPQVPNETLDGGIYRIMLEDESSMLTKAPKRKNNEVNIIEQFFVGR